MIEPDKYTQAAIKEMTVEKLRAKVKKDMAWIKDLDKREETASDWISVDEFQLEPNEGYCWILYKGRVVEAYHDHHGIFLFNRHGVNCYMTECISCVIPWLAPEPPENKS